MSRVRPTELLLQEGRCLSAGTGLDVNGRRAGPSGRGDRADAAWSARARMSVVELRVDTEADRAGPGRPGPARAWCAAGEPVPATLRLQGHPFMQGRAGDEVRWHGVAARHMVLR